MFAKKEMEKIWNIANKSRRGFIEEGKTYFFNHEEKVLDFAEIFELVIDKLGENGFSVSRTSPKKANGIIRVFRCETIITDEGVLWMYGSDTFLKTFDGMSSSYDSTINYEEYEVKLWFYQDEYSVVKPHFVDYYVKILENKNEKCRGRRP